MAANYCNACDIKYYKVIYECFEEAPNRTDWAESMFETHGIMRRNGNCPMCLKPAYLCKDKDGYSYFKCDREGKDDKSRKVKCHFKQSVYSGTWLDNVRFGIANNLLFINAYLQKRFHMFEPIHEIGLSSKTCADWSVMCGEVCESFVAEQPPIGGEGTIVEIDDSKCGKCKYNRGRRVDGVWVFGRIERGTRKKFAVAVKDSLLI